MVVACIAFVILTSQARFTHHNVSRIQAFYAAQAGTNYALEMLRTNDSNWDPAIVGLPYTHNLCRGCVAPDVDEPGLPTPVQNVAITVDDSDGDGILEIHARADYTPP